MVGSVLGLELGLRRLEQRVEQGQLLVGGVEERGEWQGLLERLGVETLKDKESDSPPPPRWATAAWRRGPAATGADTAPV